MGILYFILSIIAVMQVYTLYKLNSISSAVSFQQGLLGKIYHKVDAVQRGEITTTLEGDQLKFSLRRKQCREADLSQFSPEFISHMKADYRKQAAKDL